MSGDDVVELRSDRGFDETLARLDEALRARGVTVFARIDHAANAAAVGLSMPPATVTVFGRAEAGTPLMVDAPGLALDLPLRILVRQDAHDVVVAYHDPTAVVARAGLAPERAAGLRAVAVFAAAAAGQQPAT
jgi:uncharacterized protein (DUF302 family)